MSDQADTAFMTQALRLAERGLFTAHPNPMVGCVLVKDGDIVGEGWHKVAGEAHAEINALEAAGAAAKGATAYVTLEPCSHDGKTPPCVDALIEAGVADVVVGIQDPNPDVAVRVSEPCDDRPALRPTQDGVQHRRPYRDGQRRERVDLRAGIAR